ncbi:hypothetical protein FHY03_002223 [Sphingomonas sp. BK345]|nr:hypothetical protein [Sphingomonas sp. BK345]
MDPRLRGDDGRGKSGTSKKRGTTLTPFASEVVYIA